MRINNPKSLAGFTRTTPTDEASYKLATIGQVQNAFNILDQKFQKLLAGKMEYKPNEDNSNISNGITGLSLQCGYAWLNEDGKVDPSLLPALAITDTHVYTQTAVENFYNTTLKDTENFENDFYKILDLFLKADIKSNGTTFQKGDIIIISEDRYKNEQHQQDGKAPNPGYAGSYIIQEIKGNLSNTETSGAETSIVLAKLAYHDSNVVSVDGRYPETTNGVLNVNLKDVLATEIPEVLGVNSVDPAILRSNIYRLSSVNDNTENNSGVRFSFIDDQGHDVPYSKKEELDDEITNRIANDTELSSMISSLTDMTNFKTDFLSGKIDVINGTIGHRDDRGNYNPESSMFSKLNQLRSDIDKNADVLLSTRIDTNAYLTDLKTNLISLSNQINDNFVTLRLETISWTAENHKFVEFAAPKKELIYTAESVLGEPEVKVDGTDVWTYEFIPNDSIASEERILAIYDKDGNEIIADIQQKQGQAGKPMNSIIKIELDHFAGRDEASSLIGNDMQILIFSRRKDLKFNFVESDPIEVGAGMEEAKTPSLIP